VRADGPAARAGLRVDDVIVSFDGRVVGGSDRLASIVDGLAPGAVVPLEARRGAEAVSLRLEMGATVVDVITQVLRRQLPTLDDRDRTGLRVAEVTEDVRKFILGTSPSDAGTAIPGTAGAGAASSDAPRGGLLVIENLPGGPAFYADVRIRDLIIGIGGQKVTTIADFRAALKGRSYGDEAPFELRREGAEISKTIEISEEELRKGGYDLLGLVEYRREPGWRRFELIWELLFNSQTYHSVRKREAYPQNSTQVRWGTLLNLVHWSSTPKRKELRLLWLFPISFSSE
jgi:S1-C subfamily serine protease